MTGGEDQTQAEGAPDALREAPILAHDGVWCCERKSKCKWQGFALHKGLAWGTPEATFPEWRQWHERQCGGRLIQLAAPSPVLPAAGPARPGHMEMLGKLADALPSSEEANIIVDRLLRQHDTGGSKPIGPAKPEQKEPLENIEQLGSQGDVRAQALVNILTLVTEVMTNSLPPATTHRMVFKEIAEIASLPPPKEAKP